MLRGATIISPSSVDNGAETVEFTHTFTVGTGFYVSVGSVDQTNTPLPITLLRFDAQQKGAAALLSWTTSSEINNDYFDVLKSTDGKSWSLVERIKGHGNSTS